MQLADKPLEPFGTTILQMTVPTQLSYKTPLVFRMIKELEKRHYLPEGGDPRVELALDEALTNAMVHGNKLDARKEVDVHLFADEERWGTIIEDEGGGFRPDALPRPGEMAALFEDMGRGITLMESIVDRLAYSPKGSAVMLVCKRRAEADHVLAASEAAAEAVAASGDAAETRAEAGPARARMEGSIAIVEFLDKRVSEHNLTPVRETADQALERSPRVVFDMRRLTYISSVFVGFLVAVSKRARAAGGKLVLAGVQPVVHEVLTAVRLDKLLQFTEGLEEALALLEEEAEV